MPAATRLYLARHGSTVVSHEDRFAGSSDVELSERGREEAERLGRRLADRRFAAIYTSPMRRSVDTATRVAGPHDLDPRPSPELVEVDHGRWEGLTRREVESKFPQEHADWERDPFNTAPRGGTTGAVVVTRVVPFIQRIAREHAGREILAVSHKATLRLLTAILLGIDPRRYRDFLDQRPCALSLFELRDASSARLLLFNDVSHHAPDH